MPDLTSHLFLQLAVILAFCRALSYVGTRYLGQADAVCEMIAGIVLGPSLLGIIAPSFQHWLFPSMHIMQADGMTFINPAMNMLYSISQIGLLIYMFLVGLEFDTALLKGRGKGIALVAGGGILMPFILGFLFAWKGHAEGVCIYLFEPTAGDISGAFFIGIAISMTAFPMLARLLYDRGLANTNFGALSLASGSIGDVVGWCLLAIMLAFLKMNLNIALVAILGGIAYVSFMLTIGRRLMTIFFQTAAPKQNINTTLTQVMVILMVCGFITDKLGLHAILGVFIAGIAMPKMEVTDLIREKIEGVTVAFLLPVFFVYSGLNTQIGLINTPVLWFVTLIIVGIAIAGKLVACTLGARLAGENWRDSMTVGALMNCRGLMELIVLNIGLEYHIITPSLFSIMVFMTLLTTFMTTPLFNAICSAGKTIR